jgi:hypothetical protein
VLSFAVGTFFFELQFASLELKKRRKLLYQLPQQFMFCTCRSVFILICSKSTFFPLFFFGGFPENGPEELMFGCICGNPKSLANPGEATGLFITIKKIKYVSININMINLIYVYLFVYVLVCTYQLRKTYLDLPMAVQILRWFLVVVVVTLPS